MNQPTTAMIAAALDKGTRVTEQLLSQYEPTKELHAHLVEAVHQVFLDLNATSGDTRQRSLAQVIEYLTAHQNPNGVQDLLVHCSDGKKLQGAFLRACANADVGLMTILEPFGDVHHNENEALRNAIYSNNLHTVQWVVERTTHFDNASKLDTQLLFECVNRDVSIMKAVLPLASIDEARCALSLVCLQRENNDEHIALLLSKCPSEMPISNFLRDMTAAGTGQSQGALMLVDHALAQSPLSSDMYNDLVEALNHSMFNGLVSVFDRLINRIDLNPKEIHDLMARALYSQAKTNSHFAAALFPMCDEQQMQSVLSRDPPPSAALDYVMAQQQRKVLGDVTSPLGRVGLKSKI